MGDSTRILGRKWSQSVNELARAKQKVRSAECVLLNAANALGKHLDPGDQKIDEVFCCWVHFDFDNEHLIESIKDRDGDYRVQKRAGNKRFIPKPRPMEIEPEQEYDRITGVVKR